MSYVALSLPPRSYFCLSWVGEVCPPALKSLKSVMLTRFGLPIHYFSSSDDRWLQLLQNLSRFFPSFFVFTLYLSGLSYSISVFGNLKYELLKNCISDKLRGWILKG